jgi:hypothetical protein
MLIDLLTLINNVHVTRAHLRFVRFENLRHAPAIGQDPFAFGDKCVYSRIVIIAAIVATIIATTVVVVLYSGKA